MNSSFTTRPFAQSRGVRQGGPLSLPVYNIALETLAIKIRGIKGITIRDEPVKLSVFTDDMTCFIKDSKPVHYTEDFW